MDLRKLPGAVPCTFKKGDILIHAGEAVENVYYLESGVVHRNILSKNGSETTASIKSSGKYDDITSLLGILLLFSQDKTIGYSTFVAHTDCKAYKISAESINAFIGDNPVLLRRLIVHALEEQRTMLKYYHQKQDRSTVSQLSLILLDRFSEKGPASITFSNKDLAMVIGVHPVTISRILRKMKESGIITKTNGFWQLMDRDELTKLAQGKRPLSYRYKK